MTASLATRPPTPNPGDLVVARGRNWLVTDVRPSSLPLDPRSRDGAEGETVVGLSSVEDDGIGDELSVLWEVEPGRRILESGTLPDPSRGRFDEPATIGQAQTDHPSAEVICESIFRPPPELSSL